MMEFMRISSSADFDFERLFADSFPSMEGGSYVWPMQFTTYQEKLDAFKRHFDFICGQPEGFAYKCADDGFDMVACVGKLTKAGSLEVILGLKGPDKLDSRAFGHDAAYHAAQLAFLATEGITERAVQLIAGSETDVYTDAQPYFDKTKDISRGALVVRKNV